MGTHVSLKIEKEIGFLTFTEEKENKPPTIDFNVLNELEEKLRIIREKRFSCRVIVVQSSSKKYFNVGANLEVLKKINKYSVLEWVRRGHAVFNELENLPVPVIAKVEGWALGGGLELAMTCDLIAATNEAKFGQPEVSLGFVPGWGGSFRLPLRIGLVKAKELIFTGKVITASEAYDMGLINFVGNKLEMEKYIESTYEAILKNSNIAINMVKQLIKSNTCFNMEKVANEEAISSSICLASGDTTKRLENFFKEREKKSNRKNV